MAVYEQSWYMIYQGRTAKAGIFGGEKPRRQKGSRKEYKERGRRGRTYSTARAARLGGAVSGGTALGAVGSVHDEEGDGEVYAWGALLEEMAFFLFGNARVCSSVYAKRLYLGLAERRIDNWCGKEEGKKATRNAGGWWEAGSGFIKYFSLRSRPSLLCDLLRSGHQLPNVLCTV